jgi:hypothetical protein
MQAGIWISLPSEPRRTCFAGIAKYLLVFGGFQTRVTCRPRTMAGSVSAVTVAAVSGDTVAVGEPPSAAPPPACAPRAPRLTADQKVRIGMSCECAPSRRARSSARLTVEPMHPVGTGHALAGTAELRAALDRLAAAPRRAP